ncbi:MAG TPA: phage integrase N-terminal SAM-like domain-containing protein [Gemmataceae bacterium]|nr:phage integrase N-terminal SAM-like domain-containing protein [Gemmataceae bacterium]
MSLRGKLTVAHHAYPDRAERFVLFHGVRHPEGVGEAEVNAIPSHPAVGRKVGASAQNQAMAALLFLYDAVLGRPLDQLRVVRAARPKRLPVVLGRDEVKRGGGE